MTFDRKFRFKSLAKILTLLDKNEKHAQNIGHFMLKMCTSTFYHVMVQYDVANAVLVSNYFVDHAIYFFVVPV